MVVVDVDGEKNRWSQVRVVVRTRLKEGCLKNPGQCQQ